MSSVNSKNKKKEVPIEKQILEWAKDLGYPYQNQLYTAENSSQISEEDLRNLCKHNLLPLLEFLVTHVKKESDIKKIRALLAKSVNHSLTTNRKTTSLYRIQAEYKKEKEEKKKLIAQINDLKQSINALKSKIEIQSKKCKELSELIIQNGKEIEQNKNDNELLKKRIYIQECYQNQCEQYSEVIKKYKLFLNELKMKKKELKTNEETLKSSNEIRIRNTCEKIDNKDYDNMSSEVENIINKASGNEILNIMFSLTKESKAEFQEMSKSIEKDPIRLKLLKEKNEKGFYNSNSRVQKVLNAISEEHVNSFIKTEDLLNKSDTLLKECTELKEKIDKKIESSQSDVELKKLYMEKKIEQKNNDYMISFLENYNDNIEKSYNKLNKEWNEIKTKISFIEISESQLEKSKKEINDLLNMNKLISNEIFSEFEKTRNIVIEKLDRSKEKLSSMINHIGKYVSEEYKYFSNVDINKITIVDKKRYPKNEDTLLINQIKNFGLANEIKQQLDIPFNKEPEYLFDYIMKIRHQINVLDDLNNQWKNVFQVKRTSELQNLVKSIDTADFKDDILNNKIYSKIISLIEEVVTSHDEACINHYQPLLEQQLSICKELYQQYDNVNETIEEREKLYMGELENELTRDGVNYQEYLSRVLK